jgi:hypothetical protein
MPAGISVAGLRLAEATRAAARVVDRRDRATLGKAFRGELLS